MCLLMLLVFLGPRFAILVYWLGWPARWEAAFTTAIGPILLGVNKPVTVLPRDANVDTIISMTAYTVARVD